MPSSGWQVSFEKMQKWVDGVLQPFRSYLSTNVLYGNGWQLFFSRFQPGKKNLWLLPFIVSHMYSRCLLRARWKVTAIYAGKVSSWFQVGRKAQQNCYVVWLLTYPSVPKETIFVSSEFHTCPPTCLTFTEIWATLLIFSSTVAFPIVIQKGCKSWCHELLFSTLHAVMECGKGLGERKQTALSDLQDSVNVALLCRESSTYDCN